MENYQNRFKSYGFAGGHIPDVIVKKQLRSKVNQNDGFC